MREVVLRHFSDLERYPPQAVGDLPALLGRLRGRGLALGIATMDDTAIAHATAATARHRGPARLHRRRRCRARREARRRAWRWRSAPPAVSCPAEVIVVGDTPADLLMARNAGCARAIAVRTGATPLHLVEPLADHVLGSVQELERLL